MISQTGSPTTAGPAGSTSHTVSHNAPVGTDYILVGLSYDALGGSDSASSVTYAGGSLVKLGRTTNGNRETVEIWRKTSPSSGTNDVVVNWSGSIVPRIGITTWSGVDQTTPEGSYFENTGSDTTPTVTVTGGAAGEIVHDVMASENSLSGHGGGQTEQWSDWDVDFNEWGAGTTKDGASSVNMSHTVGSNTWAIAAVSIKPVASSPAIASVNWITA